MPQSRRCAGGCWEPPCLRSFWECSFVFSMRFSGRIRHLQSFAERLVETKASKEIWSEADDELGSLAFVEPHGSSIAQLLRPVEHGVGAA